MWIRSQNQEVLKNCDTFYICKEHFLEEEISFVIYSGSHILGVYSTKKKALKVLNMIEKRLNEGTQRYSKVLYFSKENSSFVDYDVKDYIFKMPQEDEV